ncbi:MAG TPA: hypothetical protein VNN79_15270 [Actinomycetota bacterium]|nr:hypothetical protein [Actinomycetota bacterium]
MQPNGRGSRARIALVATAVMLSVVLAACHGDKGGAPTPTPSPPPVQPSPSPSPTPVAIGTQDVAAWAAVWKDAFQQFANDLSDVVSAAKHRDFGSMRDALGRLPGDAHEAVRKIDEAGAAPPGFQDEVARLRSLVDQAAVSAGRLSADCLSNPGLPCAADVATILSVAGQIMDALKPFGVPIDFHITI